MMNNLENILEPNIVKITIQFSNGKEKYIEDIALENFLKYNTLIIKEEDNWKFLNKSESYY
jgi:hypothetical protein